MLKFKAMAYLLVFVLSISLTNAATIHGTIYDLSLKKVSNAVVEISTSPKQIFVAQNGTYSFNIPNGFYAIKAQLSQKSTVIASVQENVTIKQDGSYVLDLILFPDIEEGVEDINLDVNENLIEGKNNSFMALIAVLSAAAILIVLYYYKKSVKQKKEAIKKEIKTGQELQPNDYNDLGQIISIIKKEGGRATQKDIRKQIPLSEAKISLMIAELEHKGIIEKIKKGRGNIIILRRK